MGSAKVLEVNEVLLLMKHDISDAQDIVGLPCSVLRVLLDYFNWDLQALMDGYFTNDQLMFKQAELFRSRARSCPPSR